MSDHYKDLEIDHNSQDTCIEYQSVRTIEGMSEQNAPLAEIETNGCDILGDFDGSDLANMTFNQQDSFKPANNHSQSSLSPLIEDINHSDSRNKITSNRIASSHHVNQNQSSQINTQNNQEYFNSDEAFIAFCADTSSVLNNDPNRRCYINKLYQPLNGTQDDSEEQDDELLLYKELQYLEYTANQELNDGRQRAQLTKILEDDDGDDILSSVDQCHSDDVLDSINLTNIIESFGSFPPSPIENSNRNELINDNICNVETIDKPDSTLHGEMVPSGRSSAISNDISLTLEQGIPFIHNDLSHQYNISAMDTNSKDTHLLAINPKQPLKYQPHFSQANQITNHQHQYNHFQDNLSDSSSFQVVSSSLISPKNSSTTFSSPSSASGSMNQENYPVQTMISPNQQDLMETDNCKARKRNSHDNDGDDEDYNILEDVKGRSKLMKSRGKRRRHSHISEPRSALDTEANNSIENIADDTLSPEVMTNFQISRSASEDDPNRSDDVNNPQSETMINNKVTTKNHHDEELSTQDEATSSGGNKNPHMSKYRRRTANARERIRMREINQAFEELRKVVPVELIQQVMSGDESDQTSINGGRRSGNKSNSNNQSQDSQGVKLTKITTLRLAVSYIAMLTETLNQDQSSGEVSRIPALISSSNQEERGTKTPLRGTIDGRIKGGMAKRHTEKRKRRPSQAKLREDIKAKSRDTSCRASNLNGQSEAPNTRNHLSLHMGSQRIFLNQAEPIKIQQPQQQQVIIPNGLFNRAVDQSNSILTGQKESKVQSGFLNCNNTMNTSNGQERAFVTPVVAILGIPTNNFSSTANNESQPIQILGLHHPNQAQNQKIHAGYNLVPNQPQQLTFTLNDINGLQVLRLSNNQDISQAQRDFSQSRSTIHQAQMTPKSGVNQVNYTTIQPMHLSQIQTSISAANVMHNNGLESSTKPGLSQCQASNNINPSSGANPKIGRNDDTQVNHLITLRGNTTSTTDTGINSDCINSGPSQNTILQQSNCNNTLFSKQQIESNQPIYNSQLSNANNLISFSPSPHFVQQQRNINTNNNNLINRPETNLIYINSSGKFLTINQSNIQNPVTQTQTMGSSTQDKFTNQQSPSFDCSQGTQSENPSPVGISQQSRSKIRISGNIAYEQMKFVTQPNVSGKDVCQGSTLNEANITQLVTSLATSIQPNNQSFGQNVAVSSSQSQSNLTSEQSAQIQQPKKTYRFHNYDGNMITNYLYSNNHDKQQNQLQSVSNAKEMQQKEGQKVSLGPSSQLVSQPTQRSRQNSLSSICSSTSSASSLVSGISNGDTSPNSSRLQTIMVKSPALECNSNSSSVSSEVPVAPPSIVGNVAAIG